MDAKTTNKIRIHAEAMITIKGLLIGQSFRHLYISPILPAKAETPSRMCTLKQRACPLHLLILFRRSTTVFWRTYIFWASLLLPDVRYCCQRTWQLTRSCS